MCTNLCDLTVDRADSGSVIFDCKGVQECVPRKGVGDRRGLIISGERGKRNDLEY